MSRTVWATVGGLAAAAAVLSATVAVPTEFREIVADAALIASAHVTDLRSVVVRGSGIETVATLAIDDVVKGTADPFVSIHFPGGEVGRDRFVMVGAPRLSLGQQAVFFLKRGPDNAWRPVGLTMGIYRLQTEALTGRAVVDPPLVSGQTASVGMVVRGDVRRRPMPLQDFESLIRLVMATQALAQGTAR